MLGVERGKCVEQRLERARRDRAHREPAPDQPVHLIDRRPHGSGGSQCRPCVPQSRLAGRRQGGGSAGTVDQLRPRLVLKRADLGADTRLADVHPRRSPGEVRLLDHCDEVLQLPQFHNSGF